MRRYLGRRKFLGRKVVKWPDARNSHEHSGAVINISRNILGVPGFHIKSGINVIVAIALCAT